MMNIYHYRVELCLEIWIWMEMILQEFLLFPIPPTDTSVVSKKYVKDNYVNSSGGTGMIGNLDMNTNIIFNLANDSSLASAVNREYVHSTILQKSGGTMKGDINLNNNDINGLPSTPPTNSSAIKKNSSYK